MNLESPKEVLDSLLEGDPLTLGELEIFMQKHSMEGQHHDFKDGLLLKNLKKARKEVREYVSGFANAEGGLLIIGVDENKPREISPLQWSGDTSPDKWAEDVIQDMVAFFSPLPRLMTVDHASGPVLVIAVPRAPGLVPCVESRELKYFIRLNQSTIEVPAFLLTDLVLGRRRQPSLCVNVRIPRLLPSVKPESFRLNMHFHIENTGIVPADCLELGIVGWSNEGGGSDRLYGQLLSYVDVREPNFVGPWSLKHRVVQHPQGTVCIAPFRELHIGAANDLCVPTISPRYRFEAALYVLAEGSPPMWFQLALEWPEIATAESKLTLFPLLNQRPSVTSLLLPRQ